MCPTLWDPMDCSPPDSSVPGILQARTLEWVAIPFCRGSSWPRDQTWVSCMAGRFFTIWATWEAPNLFFAYGYSIIPASCVEKTIISPLNCLSPLLKINFRYICGLISGFFLSFTPENQNRFFALIFSNYKNMILMPVS